MNSSGSPNLTKSSQCQNASTVADGFNVFPCDDTLRELPSDPSRWPQQLLLRPTPNSTTRIKGIRCLGEKTYQNGNGFCNGCTLPINRGYEVSSECLAIDFESTYFIGTMILRIKGVINHKDDKDEKNSYFDGKKRTFQAVIRGQFKKAISMNHCVTGQTFDRPLKLPSPFIYKAFVSLISRLAPHLEVVLDANSRFLAPLVATAQTVLVESRESSSTCDILDEDRLVEPPSSEKSSVLWDLDSKTQESKAKMDYKYSMRKRKKTFNSLAAKKAESPLFSTQKIYTFEFYQHILEFEDGISVNLGSVIGKVGLAKITNGQPIKIMSAWCDPVTKDLDTLWSFEIWDESFFRYAKAALRTARE